MFLTNKPTSSLCSFFDFECKEFLIFSFDSAWGCGCPHGRCLYCRVTAVVATAVAEMADDGERVGWAAARLRPARLQPGALSFTRAGRPGGR